jgi:hypothetical protein
MTDDDVTFVVMSGSTMLAPMPIAAASSRLLCRRWMMQRGWHEDGDGWTQGRRAAWLVVVPTVRSVLDRPEQAGNETAMHTVLPPDNRVNYSE